MCDPCIQNHSVFLRKLENKPDLLFWTSENTAFIHITSSRRTTLISAALASTKNSVITMRVFVKVCCNGGSAASGQQTFAIPCNEPSARVASLKSIALDRWSATGGETSRRDADSFKLTLSGTGALLSDKDAIQDVLRDGEFVNLCKRHCKVCTERSASLE